MIAKCVVALFLLGASLQSSPLPADSTYTLITVEARKGAQGDTKLRAGDVMLSSGIEPFGGNEFSNPQVDAAIAAVQRAVVPVFVIYAPPSGHSGHSFWRTNWGQTYLSRLADESGGESYDITGINVVSY